MQYQGATSGMAISVSASKVLEAAQSRKRKKQVFSTGEIPHLFAHKVQESGRNAQGNFYFTGADGVPVSLWSYGSHWEIARHVTTKRGNAVLWNSDTTTVTTTGQTRETLSAIPPDVPKFRVTRLQQFDLKYNAQAQHKKQLEGYAYDIELHLLNASRARSSWRKESEHGTAQKLTDERNAYVLFFGLRNKPLADVPALDSEQMKAIKAKESARQKAGTEKAKREKAERLARMASAIGEWRGGSLLTISLPYDAPAMLRVKDGNVETSRGAIVPVAHAKRALTLVRAVLSRGETWHTNGHTCHLGPYKLDSIDADGTLRAGCHVISRAEWERIAPILGAYTPAEQISEQEAN
jgi:hypothetical protein